MNTITHRIQHVNTAQSIYKTLQEMATEKAFLLDVVEDLINQLKPLNKHIQTGKLLKSLIKVYKAALEVKTNNHYNTNFFIHGFAQKCANYCGLDRRVVYKCLDLLQFLGIINRKYCIDPIDGSIKTDIIFIVIENIKARKKIYINWLQNSSVLNIYKEERQKYKLDVEKSTQKQETTQKQEENTHSKANEKTTEITKDFTNKSINAHSPSKDKKQRLCNSKKRLHRACFRFISPFKYSKNESQVFETIKETKKSKLFPKREQSWNNSCNFNINTNEIKLRHVRMHSIRHISKWIRYMRTLYISISNCKQLPSCVFTHPLEQRTLNLLKTSMIKYLVLPFNAWRNKDHPKGLPPPKS